MTKYPTDEEIKQIVARRKQLAQELIGYLILTEEREQNERFKQLVSRYGQADVDRELASYRDRANILSNPDNENSLFYNKYVEFYRRFGGDRPFLRMKEYIEANAKATPLIIKHEMNQPMSQNERKGYAYLSDLLLKDAIFWDGIVPENPPPTMPEVNLPSPNLTVPQLAAGHPLSSYPLCPDDGFPLIMVDDELTCCFDMLNNCLGQRRVVDVVRWGQTVYYVFDDGHELPLLCACCGQGLLVKDLAAERNAMYGRRFIGMTMNTSVIEEEDHEYEQFVLEFSKGGTFSHPLQMPVAFEVAAELRHPLPATTRRPGSTSKKKDRSQKKTRSQKKAQSRKKSRSRKRRNRKKKR